MRKRELADPGGKVWLICPPEQLYDAHDLARDRYDDDRVAEKRKCIA